MRIKLIHIGIILVGILEVTPSRADAEILYKGFTIDESACSGMPQMDSMVSRTRDQIDLLSGVGESEEMLRFFQSIRITLKPIPLSGGTPGLYLGNQTRDVEILPVITLTGHKPVLLHEMLHAYHDLKLEGGFMNNDILRYYLTARSRHLFDSHSHMMSNQREFFACAATTYLFGVTAQEPFTRERLKQCDPEFYSYLESLFGSGAGGYTGWLSFLPQKKTSSWKSLLLGASNPPHYGCA
jgi:hypothetical protein